MIAGVIGYDSIRKHLAECVERGKRNTIHMDVYIDIKDTFKELGREGPEE